MLIGRILTGGMLLFLVRVPLAAQEGGAIALGPAGSVAPVWFLLAGAAAGAAVASLMIVLRHRKRAVKTERILRAYRVISECNQALTRSNDEQRLAEEICKLLVTSGNYSLAWVGYAERDDRKSVRPVASAGNVYGYLQTIRVAWSDDTYGWGPVGVAIREGRTTAVQNIEESGKEIPWKEAARECGYRSFMSVPVRVDRRDVGALTIYSKDPGAFDEQEKELLQGLAEDLGYGIAALRTDEERSRVQRELEANQERLKRAERLGQFGSWEYNIRAYELTWSDELYRIFGYKPREVTPGKHIALSHITEDTRIRMEAALKKALAGEGGFTIEHSVYKKDGSIAQVLSMADVVEDKAGKPERIIGALHDISERKWWEEALQQTLDERETLLRELLHRSKNTLQVITSMINLRRTSIGEPHTQTFLLELESKLHSMALVHEKLYESESFSRLNLHEYVRELGELLRNALVIDPNRISCRYELEEMEGSIETAVPLGLIFNELFTNAVHHGFAEGSSGEVRIELSFDGESREVGRLTMRDSGRGLPPGFDPERSSGLGIQTVTILARSQLRGEVEFRSVDGTECTVWFRTGLNGAEGSAPVQQAREE